VPRLAGDHIDSIVEVPVTAHGADLPPDPDAVIDPIDRFLEYRRTGDQAIRNELVVRYQWVAVRCARRFAGRNENMDDLVQVAQLGVLKAVMRFDPDLGNTFSTFAVPTVLGELRRHFRDATWAVHVPRAAKDRSLQLRHVVQTLGQRLGRTPTVADLATELGVSEDRVLEAMEAGNAYRCLSIDGADAGDGTEAQGAGRGAAAAAMAAGAPAVDDSGATSDVRLDTERIVGLLPDRWQPIVQMRFYEGLTQAEIGQQVGISQVQVSRILRLALDRMRSIMDAESELARAG
jgi:RNA polymerase sigma-B factor